MTTRRKLMQRTACLGLLASLAAAGCREKPLVYGRERQLNFPSRKRQVWAVAPAVNLSGQPQVDPLLQADMLFQQLQQVNGLTVIPVNRVAEVYASLRIGRVESDDQAALVCDLLGCDALVVPTVTAWDPYNPPKVGASLGLFGKGAVRPKNIDPRELTREAAPGPDTSLPAAPNFVQIVGMFDAANGTVRDALQDYADGRHDPAGPYASKQYLVDMDRYTGFVYHELVATLLKEPRIIPRAKGS